MSKSTVTMSDDAHAIAVYASIAGRSTSTELTDQQMIGKTEDTEKRVSTRINNVDQFKAAQTLVNSLRACLSRFGTHVEPLGFITDSARLGDFACATSAIEAQIETHNAIIGQESRITYDVLILPIGRVLDAKAQGRLCSTVTETLTEARALAVAGDAKGLRYLLGHRKNLAALMPSIVGRVVQGALDQLDAACTKLQKLLRAGATPEQAGAMVAGDLDQVDDALAWVETSKTGVAADPHADQALQ